MASIKDQEKLLNSLIHQNDLEISDETLEYLRNPTTPEEAKLDALIDLMSNTMRSLEETNKRLDVQHQEHIENQQKAEVWHEEDLKRYENDSARLKSESRKSWLNIVLVAATLAATIYTIIH